MAKLNYQKMNLDDIINWCQANDKVDWLKKAAADKPDFITLKRKFAKEFMPDIVPVAKPKKPTMWEKINAL